MLFPGNLLTGTEKTKSKPGETTTEIYNKPRLTRITKFTTMQNNHDSLVQTVFLVAYFITYVPQVYLSTVTLRNKTGKSNYCHHKLYFYMQSEQKM